MALVIRCCCCVYAMWSSDFVKTQNLLTLVLLAIVVRMCKEECNPQGSMPNSIFWAYSILGIVFSLIESNLIHQDYLKSKSNSSKIIREYALNDSNKLSKSCSKKRIEGMDALRFIASIHIVIYHFYLSNGTEHWKLFAFWGRSAITFFFILSGFVLSHQYAEKCSALSFSIADFWLKRIPGRYPSYLYSIILILLLIPLAAIKASTILLMLCCLQTWVWSVFENDINTPSWTVGALLFLYLIFPPFSRIITSTTDLLTLWCTLLWFYLVTVLGSIVQTGYVVGAPYYPLYQLIFKAHFAEFAIGAVLGWIYIRHQQEGITYKYINRFGGTATLLLFGLLYSFIDIRGNTFLVSFGANGLLSPLFSLLIWSTGSGEDVLLSGVFSSTLLKYLGEISYQIYILQAFTYRLCSNFGIREAYFPLLLACSSFTYHFVQEPGYNFVTSITKNTASATAANSVSVKRSFQELYMLGLSPAAKEKVLVVTYYILMLGAMTLYVCTMVFCLEGYSPVSALRNDSAPGRLLEGFRWAVFIVCSPSYFCTFVGQIVWCPWKKRSLPSMSDLTQQFQHRLFFRIVTRGSHPHLVQQNALEALRVLDSCLPRELFYVEVVTDNAINAAEYIAEQTTPSNSVSKSSLATVSDGVGDNSPKPAHAAALSPTSADHVEADSSAENAIVVSDSPEVSFTQVGEAESCGSGTGSHLSTQTNNQSNKPTSLGTPDEHLSVVAAAAVESFFMSEQNLRQIEKGGYRCALYHGLGGRFQELVVPSSYYTSTGAKFKARALQYAIDYSLAADNDWIVHLDEETKFDKNTVHHCLYHCVEEDRAIASGEKRHGNIGQGPILYGRHAIIENYVNTLADRLALVRPVRFFFMTTYFFICSIRVGDDFGKFRLQYETHLPWIGMHGSFVVCSNAVEKEVSFNHGIRGSITEDAYFALVAWAK